MAFKHYSPPQSFKQHIDAKRFFLLKRLIQALKSFWPNDIKRNEEMWERTVIEKDGTETYTVQITIMKGRFK